MVPGCEVLLPPGQHALPRVAAGQGGCKIVAVPYGQHALPSMAASLRQGCCKFSVELNRNKSTRSTMSTSKDFMYWMSRRPWCYCQRHTCVVSTQPYQGNSSAADSCYIQSVCWNVTRSVIVFQALLQGLRKQQCLAMQRLLRCVLQQLQSGH